jgi:hypothetical protein
MGVAGGKHFFEEKAGLPLAAIDAGGAVAENV